MKACPDAIPPVDQISPPTRPVEKKPAWFACRADGRLGGEAAQAPAGQVAVFSWSTASDGSNADPPFMSPPSA
jgi:hypothetical protein